MAKKRAKTSRGPRGEDPGGTPSVDWLEELEEKVHAASRALRELRGRNRELNAENESLQKRLGQAEKEVEKAKKARKQVAAAGEAGAGAGAGGDGDGRDTRVWKRERQEIRERVERITERLQELLEG